MEDEFYNYHTQRLQDKGLTDARKVSELEKDEFAAYHSQREKEVISKKKEPVNYGDVGWGKVILKSISDLPGSIPGGIVKDIEGIKEFFSSPIVNTKGLVDLFLGHGALTRSRLDETLGFAPKEKTDKEAKRLKMALMFEDEMYKLFGTEENFKRTIAEKPYETFSTITSMFVPAAKVGGLEKVAKIASYAEPINLATLAAKTPLTALMQIPKIRDLPVNLASRTLKVLADMPENRRIGLVNTFLDNRSVTTFSEVEKITGQMDELNKIINKAISEQDFAAIWFDPTKRMEVDKIYKGLDDLKKKTLENSSYGTDAAKAIDHVKEVLQKSDTELKRTEMIPSEVQSRKVKFNKELSDAYQKSIQALEDTPIKNEAKMVINRNMRTFLETVIPDISVINDTKLTNKLLQERFPGARALNIKELNRLEGDLAEIRHAIQDTANKSRFGNLASWQLVTKMGAFSGMGYAAGSLVGAADPAAWAKVGGALGAALGAFDSSPYLKSKVAVYLKDLQTFGLSNTWNNPNAAMIRMGLYDISRISSTQEDANKQ